MRRLGLVVLMLSGLVAGLSAGADADPKRKAKPKDEPAGEVLVDMPQNALILRKNNTQSRIKLVRLTTEELRFTPVTGGAELRYTAISGHIKAIALGDGTTYVVNPLGLFARYEAPAVAPKVDKDGPVKTPVRPGMVTDAGAAARAKWAKLKEEIKTKGLKGTTSRDLTLAQFKQQLADMDVGGEVDLKSARFYGQYLREWWDFTLGPPQRDTDVNGKRLWVYRFADATVTLEIVLVQDDAVQMLSLSSASAPLLRPSPPAEKMGKADPVDKSKADDEKTKLTAERARIEAERAKLETERTQMAADKARVDAERAKLEAEKTKSAVKPSDPETKVAVNDPKETSPAVSPEPRIPPSPPTPVPPPTAKDQTDAPGQASAPSDPPSPPPATAARSFLTKDRLLGEPRFVVWAAGLLVCGLLVPVLGRIGWRGRCPNCGRWWARRREPGCDREQSYCKHCHHEWTATHA